MNGSHYKTLTRRWRLDPSDVLRPEELQRMVKLAQGRAQVTRTRRWKARDLSVMVLAGQQGLRVCEIAALQICHLDRLGEGILYVPTAKLRGTERGAIDESLVDDGVRVAIERYLRTLPTGIHDEEDYPLFFNPRTGAALTRRALQLTWQVYAGAADVRKSIHSGRHLAATIAIQAGGVKFAQRKLRHRSLASTLIYDDLDFERERTLLEDARIV